MPTYRLTFPRDAAGLDVEVVEQRTGTVTAVETDAIDGPAGDLVYRIELDEADYTGFAKTTTGVRAFSTDVVLDIPASIAQGGGGVGAAETAYFVATGDVSADTAGADATRIVWVADDRHDALPTWASIDGDGQPQLSDEAGTCAYNLRARYNFDFSDTTPQGSDGTLANIFDITVDGVSATGSNNTVPGDGQDEQAAATDISMGLIATTIYVEGYPTASDVTDGTATPQAALTITRIAQAAVLPA